MESALRSGSCDPELRLIETMRFGPSGAARWPLHLARLCASAQLLGWSDPRIAADTAIKELSHPEEPMRLRLTLDQQGRITVTQAALPEPAPLWNIGLASARLASDDPWLRLKSTRRFAYDAARAALPAGVDEVIFSNERGEVCDGTITNVFFARSDGVMRTPPLASGLLPGVLRAELACPEDVLYVENLPNVQLWVGNALRGLMPALWVG